MSSVSRSNRSTFRLLTARDIHRLADRERRRKSFGRWRRVRNALIYRAPDSGRDEQTIDLDRCTTATAVLHQLAHVAEKSEAFISAADIGDLVRAIHTIRNLYDID